MDDAYSLKSELLDVGGMSLKELLEVPHPAVTGALFRIRREHEGPDRKFAGVEDKLY